MHAYPETHTTPHIVIHRYILHTLAPFSRSPIYIICCMCQLNAPPFVLLFHLKWPKNCSYNRAHTQRHNKLHRQNAVNPYMNVCVFCKYYYSDRVFFIRCKNEVIRLLMLCMYQCKHCCYPEPMPPPSLHLPHLFFLLSFYLNCSQLA